MKRYLYYDQDSINSLLAQIEQGLLVKDSVGEEESETYSEESSVKADLSGDLSAKVLGIGSSLKGTLQGDDSGTEAATNLIRSVQEKVLHDYAFERVLAHVMDNDLVNNENPRIGDIVMITETPTFLDFEYFQALFAEDGPVKFSNDQNRRNIESLIEGLKGQAPKGKQLPLETRQKFDEAKRKISNDEAERKELGKTIEVLKNTLPYRRFVMTTNMLIPLQDENLRDNPKIVAFKYGGRMTTFGYITNIVSDDETPERNNDYAPLYDTINQVMLKMFRNQNRIYIVHPVALYY